MFMFVFFFLVIFLIIFSSSIRHKDGWKDSYTSIEQSHSVEGIFVILIFMGHVVRYFGSFNALDVPYVAVKNHLDQAVVSLFLFYSGFGMTQSLKKNGTVYLKKLPSKRVIPLLIKYDLLVLIYFIVRLFIGGMPDLRHILLSFTGWENLGNFGWYVFILLCLYTLFSISFFISHKTVSGHRALITGVILLTVLSVLFMLLLSFPGQRGRWFYDTILIFCFGSWYSVFKDKCDAFLESHTCYIITCVICMVLYAVSSYFRDLHFIIYELFVFCFTSAVLLITVKISIKSKALDFFGSLAFPMFMLQGLSFQIFTFFNLQAFPYLFFLLTFTVSLLLSIAFNKISGLFKPNNTKFSQIFS